MPKDRMINACQRGDVEKVQKLLRKYPSLLNKKLDWEGMTALHYGSWFNKENVVKVLLAANAYINPKNDNGLTPLHYASMDREASVVLVRMLLAANADINAKDKNGSTPLHYARANKVEVLLEANADVNAKNKDGETPLHYASKYGKEDKVKVLLEANADINAKNKNGKKPGEEFGDEYTSVEESEKQPIRTILKEERDRRNKKQQQASIKDMIDACQRGDVEKVKQLLQESPSFLNKHLDENGRAPLHFASWSGKENVVLALLAANADVSAKNKNGLTPLHYASKNGKKNVVEVLLAVNVDINAKDNYGQTPLHNASALGHENVVEVLLEANADISAKNENGRTPLHYASKNGRDNVVKVLLAANADIDAKNNDGKKPGEEFDDCVNESKKQQIRTMLKEERDTRNKTKDMIVACQRGDVEKVKQLLQKFPSLLNEHLDEFGRTPLHFASQNGWWPKENVVEVLLAANSGINVKDKNGSTPLHYASRDGEENVTKLLLAANADINAKDNDGSTPLHYASTFGKENVAKMLLAANADVNAKRKNGSTPLHFASREGKENVVLVLLAANADIHAKDELKNTPINAKEKNGSTPLHCASTFGAENVAQVLLEANADINAKDENGNKPGDEFKSWVDETKKQQIQTMLQEERDKRNKKQQQASTPLLPPRPPSCVSQAPPPPSSASSSSPQASTPSSPPKSSISKPPPSSAPSSKDMIDACQRGDVEKVKQLLQESPSFLNEHLDELKNTALHYASWAGHEHVVEVLLAANADVSAKNKSGRTPLHYASRSGKESVVKVLLAANADIHAKDENGYTPLHYASRYGQEIVVKVMLAANADIHAKNKDGSTPLHFASSYGNEDAVRVLLAANADINAENNAGEKPGEKFFDSVNESKKQLIQTMLKEERDKRNKKQQKASTPLLPPRPPSSVSQALPPSSASSSSPQASTPSSPPKSSISKPPPSSAPSSKDMIDACQRGDVEKVKQLLQESPSFLNKHLDENDWTPLHFASSYGNENVVEVLLAANADINAKDDNGLTPLHCASRDGKESVVKVLLEVNADINAKDNKGWTPLHWASLKGEENVVKMLLAANADIHAKEKFGRTPLHYASRFGKDNVVLMLLAANADIHAKEKGGRTPLHCASEYGEASVVRVLLAANADIDAKDKKGNKPGYIFESSINESKKQQIQTMLEEERDRRNKKRQQEEERNRKALESRVQRAIQGEKKGTLQKEAFESILEACEEAELAAQETPLAEQMGNWAQSEEVQQAIDLADKMIVAALENAAQKPEKQEKKKKKDEPKTENKRLASIKKKLSQKSKKAVETVMGASGEIDGGAVDMEKEIDKHMKELLVRCEEDMNNAQQKGSADKIEDVEKELGEMLKKEKQERRNCLRMMRENLMEAEKEEDLGDFCSKYKENEERCAQKVEELRDLHMEHKSKLLKMENPIHFELFQIQEDNISFFRRIFKRKLSIRLIGYKAISVGTARRKKGQMEGVLAAANKAMKEFCPFPAGTIAMTALQAFYSLNEDRKSKNQASNMNKLQGEFSASDPLKGLNDFACDVTELATEQFSSIIRFLDTKSIKKLARVAVYAMFSVGFKKLEKKEEKEKATNNPADFFVAGTFNFNIQLYNINKFFDERVLKGEGKNLTDNVGLNWKINVVDVLRNGTIRRPHKKIYGSVDDSHNGLLNCDVPFVFVRPLRESSLPFFEMSCQFLELNVGASNCVEVKKKGSSSSIQKNVISPLWNSGVAQFVLHGVVEGAKKVNDNYDEIEKFLS